jgi:hypothetical protein
MSSYMVLQAVSRALRQVLWNEFNTDPVIAPIVPAETAIVFANPTETARDPANRLSLWLYQVTENEFVKNQPPITINGGGSRFPPLALDLSYLVTPFAPSGEADHLLLGKTMQVLYDHSTMLLVDGGNDIAEELHVVLCRLGIRELAELWEALLEPYRLSVCYTVRVTRVDSSRIAAGTPVLERIAGFTGHSAEVPR